MPEVAGDAALYVNPFSPESIADAMESIYREKGLKEQLIKKGNERVKHFSWQKTADLVWQSIEKSLNLWETTKILFVGSVRNWILIGKSFWI